MISDKANKTVVVRVERRLSHKFYDKIIRKWKKYTVHDENNQYKTGDVVKITECRPRSKNKKWEVVSS